MSEEERGWFSVPYRLTKDGTLLMAVVSLDCPLGRGDLTRISRQIGTLASLVEADLGVPTAVNHAAADREEDEARR